MPLLTPSRAQGFAIFLLVTATAFGEQVTNRTFAARAEKAFLQAQIEFTAHPNNETNAWQLGRVSFDWAEFSTNMNQKAAVSQVGIAACQHLVARKADSAPGHYYLAIDYGELAEAQAPSIAAYKLIRDIEREFKAAADLDEGFDYAGPLRCLGLLYRDAPGWPISIGSKHKAREYLDRAAARAPDSPENQLNLVESHIRWREPGEAEAAWKKLAAIWPAAQTNLTGVAWESSWDDWTTRRAAAKADFEKAFKRALEP